MGEDPTENDPSDVAQENSDLFFKDGCCQTDMKMAEVKELEVKYRDAESKLDRLSFNKNSLKHDGIKVSVCTGLPNFLAPNVSTASCFANQVETEYITGRYGL